MPMPDQATQDMIRPAIERAGLVAAVNEAWLAIGLTVLIGASLSLLLLRRDKNKRHFNKSLPATRDKT